MTDLARHINPTTGDLAYSPATASWQESPGPAVEAVYIVLQTTRGTCPLDPTLGVDWNRVRTLKTGAAGECRAAILEGLQPLVDEGTIASVSVTVSQAGASLAYAVTFTDPRNPSASPPTVTGTV